MVVDAQARRRDRRRRRDAARRYRPARTRILFVSQSPPSAFDRYFYYPDVWEQDSLWVSLMRAVYGDLFGFPAEERPRKGEWLERFKDDGYMLIEAVKDPLGRKDYHARKVKAVQANSKALVREINGISPKQIVLIGVAVHDALAGLLIERGLAVAGDGGEDGRLPLPLYDQQPVFLEKFERLVESGHLKL